uniref:phospholipase A2 n=1 Tax=Angiostrongylus cantonensis TaxID=6313 RepID=A0A0K0DPW3_ANGCA
LSLCLCGHIIFSLMKMMIQPEGKYPLHLAIEMHRLKIVRRMLKLGADASVKDINVFLLFLGLNVLHFCLPFFMLFPLFQLLWEFDECHGLINQTNNEGYAPVMLAIRAANPRCFATLLNFGAELSMRVQGRNPLFEAMQSKGKNAELVPIIEASPDLVKERDSSGNSALHVAMYKTPLMGLLFLKCKEVELNAKNNAGQTPLHIFTHKLRILLLFDFQGEIGLMITLLSYCCDIDAQDNDGNTALHIAVSKKNNEATRLLLCLGANPNLTNSNDETPRHLAARLKETTLLKSLIMCGALTCPPKKVGCVSGCVNEAMKGLFLVGYYSCCCIVSKCFKMFYDTLIARLDDLDSRCEKPSNMLNLLSLDGGGIRGLVILQILMAIEEEMKEPIFPYFDWVAGTSTGALIATALAQGKTLRDCQHIYLRFKDLIFDGWTRPYNSAVLEMFMKEAIGEKNLDDIKYPRLMISTVRADFFPVKLEFMRNYRLPLSEDENSALGFTDPSEIPTWKALRRTSAAPMFFSPVDDKYIDGGIIANNPTLDLLAETQLYNGINTYLV